MSRLVIVFESTHDAIAAKTALQSIKPIVLPTPREISSGCGIALMIDSSHLCFAEDSLRNNNIINYSIYKICEKNKKQYIKMGSEYSE